VGRATNLSDLEISVSGLYLLAAPSTPEPARAEVIAQAKKGKVSHKQVKQIVAKRKPAPRGTSLQPAKRQIKTSAKPQDPNKWTRAGYSTDGKVIYVRTDEAAESAEERKAQCATGKSEPSEACEIAGEDLGELTSAEQDQILHLALGLLMTVDHRHRQRFHKHLVSNRGVFTVMFTKGMETRRLHASLLDRVWRGFRATLHVNHAKPDVAAPVPEPEAHPEERSKAKRKRRTKAEIEAAKARDEATIREQQEAADAYLTVVAGRNRQGDLSTSMCQMWSVNR
jgi:hypothetical protein